MSTEKKLKRAHERMQMELMEPRMLLSADLLALAGLPGVDHHDDDAPWDSLLSDPSDLPGESSGNNGQLPSPLELSSFSGADAGAASSDQQSDSLLALLSDGDRTESAGQLLFVDTRVPDYADLIDQIRQAHPGDELQIHLIDAGEDGVNQITDVLANYSGIDAVHIISHGNSDGLQLGSTWLSSNNLNVFAGQLGSWSGSLTQDADLLLYGCDLAADSEGKALVDAIATLTGADVAASDDPTGHAALGGDWDLEHHAGTIESSVIVNQAFQLNWHATLDISSGLILHNSFDSDASDSSGNGYHGTLKNGALIDTTGASNKIGAGKLSLDGSNDYVDLSSHVADFQDVSEGTIAAWVYQNASGFTTVFEVSDKGDDDSRVVLGVKSNGMLSFGVFNGNTSYIDLDSESGLVAKNTWTHIAVTVDAIDGNKLYVNGAQLITNLDYIDGGAGSTEFFDDVTKLDYMAWGRDLYDDEEYRQEYRGFIDDGRVYDRALSAADILELYNYAGTPVSVDDAYTTTVDTPLGVAAPDGLLINDSDPEGDSLSAEVSDGPNHGLLSFDPLALGSANNLTNDAGVWDNQGQWSADGSRIAFVREISGVYQIFVMNADGSGAVQLTTGSANYNPSWSPDGTELAICSDRYGQEEIIVIKAADGSEARRLTTDASVDQTPSWSPDGSKIAFTSERSGDAEIWVVNADGSGGLTRLTTAINGDRSPEWSPDGSEIVFSSGRDATLSIYVMDADGSNQTRLTGDLGKDIQASWSPDGSRILFVSDRDGSDDIFVMNADGSNERSLLSTVDVAELRPAWSRDGTRVLAHADNDLVEYRLRFDGTFTYTPATGFSGSDSFGYLASDGNNLSTAATVNITVNNAPLLVDADPMLTAIGVNDFDSSGDSVAAIVVDGSISDTGSALESIAVIAVDDSNGNWQYSTNGGGSWGSVDDGSLGADHALLLDAAHKLRFVPDANFIGSASFTFRAWDQSGGSAGGYADTSVNGGASPFSSVTDTASITVTPTDSDADGLWDHQEDANTDSDFDPATNPGPDSDGDSTPNYLDSDDDGDGILTSAENADPNSDGNPRDALDSDHDGQPDWLDPALTTATDGIVDSTHKLSSTTSAALAAAIDNRDRFGSGVASIGDLDGDGVVDVAVGARNDDDGVDDTGAVYILFMNADGTIKATQKISDSSGGLTASLDNGDNFGRSVAGIGDINGDGIGDIAVGADYDDDGGSDRGAVYILMLNSDGTVKAEQKISSTAGGLTGGLANNDRFGRAVAGIGDLDGDGIDDIAVGAEKDDDGGTNRGAVYVLMLNADGTVKAQQKISDNAGGLAAALDDGDAFGVSVAGLGDLNGDGTNDIAVGTLYDDDGGSDRGAVYILFMNADGTVNAEQKISSLSGGLPAVLANGDSFGASVAAIGDANGDGTPDLLVGADADDDGGSDRGAVYLLFMNADGTVNSQQKISSTTGGLSVALDDDGWFGVSAASLGDLNGDGILDLLVGADKNNDGGNNRGAVYVLNLQAASSNSAPVLATAPAPSLTAIDEDDTTPAGDSVAAIVVDGSISDTDGAVESIAITAVDNSNGTWQYSTDNGSSWSNVDDGSLAANHALLLDGTLAGASTQKLRFVPAADYNGSASFTFRAWDQSSGSAGSYADTGSNGGTSAFSSATDSATITVNPVNDAPTLSGGPYDLGSTIAFNTSSGVQVAAILAGVTSGDNDGDTLGIAVTALSGNNLWKYSADSSDGVDGNWQDVGAVASNNALLLDQNSWLRYVPDGSNAETPAVTFHAWDRSSGSASTGTQSYADSGSGSAFSSGSAQAQLTVTPSNNPPTGGVTIDNNAPTQGQTLTAANTLADADGITPPIGYQWLRDGAPIAGATSGSYTTVQADVNKVISVTASYTDGLGNEESSTSAGTAAVLNADDAGVVTIDDTTPAQGQTLTASVSDLDGISDGIGYQWFRDGNPIAGATSISYTTLQADVGKAISVAASYTDDFGGVEAPLSADTVNVANVNDAGSISIDDTTPTQGQTLTASINDADGAGGPTSYQWYADGIAISGATNSSYTLVQDDVTKVISVAASYTDDLGSTETPLSEETSAVANVNDAGTVSINNTTPAQGQTLTASVSDSDGASGTISYQWYRDSSPISGATSGSYTTTQADVGKAVSVAASYTDDLTTVENPVSAATAPVTEVNDAPTFSQFYDALGITDEDTEVEITLATLLAVGDEADVDIGGSIDGFLVTSVASGTLKIGADAGSATAWAATTNDIVDSTNKAYWTPAGNAHGILNAFVAAAVDDAGAASSGSATGQVIVSAVNDAPTGLPTIGGAATEHVTLNVDTSGIGDADGLGSFSYQWLRDGAVVSGATGISYALDDIDVGSRMSVKISYVDDDDTSETLTSAQTAVVAAVNDAPTVLRNQLTLTQGESVILSSAMLAATDVDDDDNSLLFTLTSVNGGRFELISNPGVAIASFTQAQVSAGQVRFVDDGDNIAPSFTLQVSDSQVSVSSDASIGFAPNPKPTTLTIADNIALPATISKEDPAVNVVKADPEITDQVDDTEEETATEAEEEATAGEEAFAESAADDDRDTAAGAIENPVNQKGSTAESGSGLHSIFNHNALRNPFVNLLLGAVAAPDLPAVPKLLTSEIHTVLTASGFLKDLDRIRGTTNEASNIEQQRVASTIAVSTGLSVGYVAWLIRSGVLLSTALSSLPAWHFVDPLPVLGTIAANQSQGRGRDDEEDSVESMFKDQATPADNMESGKETQINTSRNNSDPSEHSQLQR